MAGRRDGLGKFLACVGLVKEELALEVTQLDEIAIDQSKMAHAGSGEQLGLDASQRSTADDGNTGRPDSRLPFFAQRSEAGLAGVA